VCRLTHAVAFDAAVVQQGRHPVNKQFYSVFFYLKSTSNTICSTFCHFEHISNWNWTFNKFKFSWLFIRNWLYWHTVNIPICLNGKEPYAM